MNQRINRLFLLIAAVSTFTSNAETVNCDFSEFDVAGHVLGEKITWPIEKVKKWDSRQKKMAPTELDALGRSFGSFQIAGLTANGSCSFTTNGIINQISANIRTDDRDNAERMFWALVDHFESRTGVQLVPQDYDESKFPKDTLHSFTVYDNRGHYINFYMLQVERRNWDKVKRNYYNTTIFSVGYHIVAHRISK